MELSNSIRYFHYISGVLNSQKSDCLCGNCKALSNSVNSLKENIKEFEEKHSDDIKDLPVELSQMLSEAKKALFSINVQMDAVGQKKAGNCNMPEGVCFVKTSKKIIEKL